MGHKKRLLLEKLRARFVPIFSEGKAKNTWPARQKTPSMGESQKKNRKYNMENKLKQQTIIDAAILGFEIQKQRIDEQIMSLRAQRSGPSPAKPSPAGQSGQQNGGPKRRITPEGRARIAAAQKARWAKFKKLADAGKKTSTASPAVLAALEKARAAKKKKDRAAKK